jgi:hypothetical protein
MNFLVSPIPDSSGSPPYLPLPPPDLPSRSSLYFPHFFIHHQFDFPYISHLSSGISLYIPGSPSISPWCSCISFRSPVSLMNLPTSPISIFHESLNISINNYHPNLPLFPQDLSVSPDLPVPTLRVSILDLRSIPRISCISQGYPHTSRSRTSFISFESTGIYNGFSCISQSGFPCIFHGSPVTSSISPQSSCATVDFLVSPMCLPVSLFVFLKFLCIPKLSLCISHFPSPCISHSGSLCISSWICRYFLISEHVFMELRVHYFSNSPNKLKFLFLFIPSLNSTVSLFT